MELEKLQIAKKFFFIALAIDIAVTVVVIGGDIWSMGALKDIKSGTVILSQTLQSTLDFWDNFAKLLYLTLIGVGFTLFKWLKSCYGFAKTSLQTTGLKNEGWVIWGWIVPFMNFFKPYQVISEIYKAGSPNNCNGEDWKKESGSGLLLTWWICWLVAHMIMWEYTKKVLAFKALLMKSGASPLSEGLMFAQINNLNVWHLITCALSIIVAVLWFAVANHLTNRLVARSARKMPTQQSNISATQSIARNDDDLMKLLIKKGGVHSWVWRILWVWLAVLIIGIIAAIAIPAYNDYTKKAKAQASGNVPQLSTETRNPPASTDKTGWVKLLCSGASGNATVFKFNEEARLAQIDGAKSAYAAINEDYITVLREIGMIDSRRNTFFYRLNRVSGDLQIIDSLNVSTQIQHCKLSETNKF